MNYLKIEIGIEFSDKHDKVALKPQIIISESMLNDLKAILSNKYCKIEYSKHIEIVDKILL